MVAAARRRRRRVARSTALAFAAALLALLASVSAASAATTDEDVRRIAKQLRCPVCESVSVADSPAELAVQMRGVIRTRLEAGQSEQQILEYFAVAYGESVLLEPPRRGLGWAAWVGPFAALAIGLATLLFVIRGWLRAGRVAAEAAPPAATPERPAVDDAATLDRARAELDAVRKGVAR